MNRKYLNKTTLSALCLGLSLAATQSAQAEEWNGGVGKFEDPTAWLTNGVVPSSASPQTFQLNADGVVCTFDAATWTYLSNNSLLQSSTQYRGANRFLFGQQQNNTLQTIVYNQDIGDANTILATNGTSHVLGARQFTTTTLNISSGTLNLQADTTIAANASSCTATVNISGGALIISREDLRVGGTATSVGLVSMTGGSLATRTGLQVRAASTFEVQGSAPTQIGIGSNGNGDGFANIEGTIRAMIDGGGITPIFVDDTGGGATATLGVDSVMDPSFLGIPDTVGTWTVLELEGADILDNGMELTPAAVTAGWFVFVDNSGINGLLRVSFGIAPPNPELFWDGTNGNDWDFATANWFPDTGPLQAYIDNSPVTFDNLRVNDGTINLTTSLSPTSITVKDELPFTFTGIGSISGDTGISKDGTGSLALNNTGGSDFTGAVALQNGTIVLGNATAFGDSSGDVLVTAGTLDLGGFSVAKGALTLTSGTIQNGTLTGSSLDVDAGTISAVLDGEDLTVTKNTSGTLNLDGANTYAGVTTISSGTVILGDGDALGSGTLAPLSVIDVTTTTASPVVTVTPGTEITIGSYITGTGIPAETVVGLYDSVLGEVTLSNAATADGTVSATLGGIGAALTDGNNIATVAPGTPIQVNMQVSGTGIVEATRVTAYNSVTGEVTLLANATSTSSEVLTFTGSTNLSGSSSTLDLNGQTISELIIGIATNSQIINSNAVTPAAITQEMTQVGNPIFGGPGDITISNIIRTNGVTRRMTKTGTGKLTLAGTENNGRYGLTVNEGDVDLNKPDGIEAVGRFPLIMNSAASTVTLLAGNQIHNNDDENGTMDINAGTLELNGFDEGFGALSTTNGTELDGIVTNSDGGTTSTLTLIGVHGAENVPVDEVFPGAISGNLNLVKAGIVVNTQTLSGPLTYTGNTTINVGTLELAGASSTLADSSVVTITDGILNLSNGLTDVVDELWIDGTQQSPGTYGATGSGATNIDDTHFAGAGVLSVTNGPPPPSDPYIAWAGGAAFDADSNGDGVDNGLAWMLGAADVNVDALPLLPTSVESSGALVMSFTIVNPIAPNQLFVEYSSDLAGAWTPIEIPASTGTVGAIDFAITDNGGTLDVVATINAASGGTLFGRLSAVEAP